MGSRRSSDFRNEFGRDLVGTRVSVHHVKSTVNDRRFGINSLGKNASGDNRQNITSPMDVSKFESSAVSRIPRPTYGFTRDHQSSRASTLNTTSRRSNSQMTIQELEEESNEEKIRILEKENKELRMNVKRMSALERLSHSMRDHIEHLESQVQQLELEKLQRIEFMKNSFHSPTRKSNPRNSSLIDKENFPRSLNVPDTPAAIRDVKSALARTMDLVEEEKKYKAQITKFKPPVKYASTAVQVNMEVILKPPPPTQPCPPRAPRPCFNCVKLMEKVDVVTSQERQIDKRVHQLEEENKKLLEENTAVTEEAICARQKYDLLQKKHKQELERRTKQQDLECPSCIGFADQLQDTLDREMRLVRRSRTLEIQIKRLQLQQQAKGGIEFVTLAFCVGVLCVSMYYFLWNMKYF